MPVRRGSHDRRRGDASVPRARRRPGPLILASIAVLLLAAVLGGYLALHGESGPHRLAGRAAAGSVTDALAIAGLVRDGAVDVPAVRALTRAIPGDARARIPRYDRDAYGPAWADTDGDGCDQRDDVLARDLRSISYGRSDDGCTVRTGHLDDAYTGRGIDFTRGPQTSAAVQIDHLVPLGWAWKHGAAAWTPHRREQLATDVRNLQAVDGPTNQVKSDQGPATWLPPDEDYRCVYVTRFAFIVGTYGLTIDDADRDAIGATLDACT